MNHYYRLTSSVPALVWMALSLQFSNVPLSTVTLAKLAHWTKSNVRKYWDVMSSRQSSGQSHQQLAIGLLFCCPLSVTEAGGLQAWSCLHCRPIVDPGQNSRPEWLFVLPILHLPPALAWGPNEKWWPVARQRCIAFPHAPWKTNFSCIRFHQTVRLCVSVCRLLSGKFQRRRVCQEGGLRLTDKPYLLT